MISQKWSMWLEIPFFRPLSMNPYANFHFWTVLWKRSWIWCVVHIVYSLCTTYTEHTIQYTSAGSYLYEYKYIDMSDKFSIWTHDAATFTLMYIFRRSWHIVTDNLISSKFGLAFKTLTTWNVIFAGTLSLVRTISKILHNHLFDYLYKSSP